MLSVGLVIGAAVTSAGLGWISSWAWSRFAQTVQHVVRTDAYEKIQRLGIAFFDDQQTGQILSILNDDVNELNRFLSDILQIGAQFIGIAAFLFYRHWQLALIALVPVPVLAVMSRWFITRIRPMYDDVRQRVGVLNAWIENSLSGIAVVKAYTAESFEAARIDNETEVLIQTTFREFSVDRTTFAITHRLSTVRHADTILVLQDGSIVEQGTHEHLLEQDGLYANLWRGQVGELDELPAAFLEQTVDTVTTRAGR